MSPARPNNSFDPTPFRGAGSFALANESFVESTTLDPTYGNSWRRWPMSLYEQGNFVGAWEKVKRARLQNARPFPPAFLQSLEKQLPEPN